MSEEELQLYKEIERLNNIINELEKILETCIKGVEGTKDICNQERLITYRFVLNKIKELKGSDKE